MAGPIQPTVGCFLTCFPCFYSYSETSGIVNYIASREGGADKKGKKVAVLYHGSPYGKETIPIYELLAD
jgi:branched-chain amino acid transport system substrate-binding protein